MKPDSELPPAVHLDLPSFVKMFGALEDPRIDRTKKYTLGDIIGLTLIAMICGADNWAEISRFGHERLDWLRNFIPLPFGSPSHDTIARVFAIIDPKAFTDCFIAWVSSLTVNGKLINIDGKTIRGSRSVANDVKPLHIVTAWLSEAGISLGHIAVDEKSNEIPAIPELLSIINLKDKIVSIDAMGTQKEIAQKITDNKGDYVLALKGNQGTLHESISTSFDGATSEVIMGRANDCHSITEKDHGRIEERKTSVFHNAIDWPETHEWAQLNTIIVTDRIISNLSTGKTSAERQYHISSLSSPAANLVAAAIRGHWSVENNLHWQLDVSFGEDSCLAANRNAAQNLSTVRKTALKMLDSVKKEFKSGVKSLRKMAGWKIEIAEAVLMGARTAKLT